MSRRRSTPRLRLWLFLVLGVLLVTPLFFRPTVTSTEANMSEPAALPPPPVPEIRKEIIKGTVAQGDTATGILGDYFSAGEIYELSKLCKSVFPLSRLSAGQAYRLCLSNDDFERFEYDIDQDEQLIITREAEDFSVQKVPIPYTTETVGVRGTIETSLFEAVTSTGESDVLAMNLADIFAWDIDFILDIRKDDSFQALVEKRYRDGQWAGYGHILAAEFTNRGTAYTAVRYEDRNGEVGYFDADGHSKRRAFIRSPIKFARISSRYNPKRWHPVLKKWRSHKGVDYAAPRGTAVRATGDGRVIHRGTKGGYGRTVIVEHAGKYTTLYAHLSKYSKRAKSGSRVKQGQVIGYVGKSGLASGPHLHYEFRVRGKHRDPLRVKLPKSLSLPKSEIANFRKTTTPLLTQLAAIPADTMVASAGVTETP